MSKLVDEECGHDLCCLFERLKTSQELHSDRLINRVKDRSVSGRTIAFSRHEDVRLTHPDGADAMRRAIGAANYRPPSARRVAPAIQRMQRTVVHASKLARPTAADPQSRYLHQR